MNKYTKKFASLAVVGAMAVGALGFAQSASADLITPPGHITISPTTGDASEPQFLDKISTDMGCPVNYRTGSGTFAFQNGVRMSSMANIRTSSTAYGATGLNGEPMWQDRELAPTNNFVSNKSLSNAHLAAGDWELRVYCFNRFPADIYDDTDMWMSLAMTIDANGIWAVKGTVVEVPAQATTVSLTANLGADNKATLAATVKDSTSATATAAAGSVEFLEGTTVVGTGTVANGVASATTGVLATGSHGFTAKFVSSDKVAYADSALSATASVVVVAGPAAPGSTIIDTTVPTGTGSLTFAGLQGNISLGQAVLDNGLFKANGNLGPVTVTDTRQLGSTAWSLTGQSGDFKDGTKVIDGKYLGWTPALVGTTNAGTAGATVAPAPGSANGLKSAGALSSGTVVDAKTTTTVGAQLQLAAPGNTPGGSYTATLTLTLI